MPSHDLESWMWTEACAILNRADRLHRQFFRPISIYTVHPNWEPPVDVYETRNEYKIVIALPGVSPEHLQVKLEVGHLVINGKRHLPMTAEAEIKRLEIPYGRFQRNIELPEGHFEISERVFVNGCLLISLRKI